MIHCHWRIHLLVMGLISLAVPVRAQDKVAPFSMSVDEFVQLSSADQKVILFSAFEHRLQQAKNVRYEALQLGHNHEYRDGQVGKLLVNLNGSRLRHWRLGDSFRMDTERGGVDVAKPKVFSSTGLDAGGGVGRSTVRRADNDRKIGRIDVVSDRITESNRYHYWLDGKHVPMGEYLIRYIVEHRDSYTIEAPVDQDKVRLIVPWVPVTSLKPLGTREFVLDPRKGFLPVRGKARWEYKTPDGGLEWRTEEFVVEASQLVKDVWMPTKLRELISGSPLGADKITVWETEVTKIEVGTVTDKDLEIPFPEGTEVVDATKGIAYVVGPNGEPTRVERVVGARPETVMPAEGREPPAHAPRRYGLILVIGGAVLVLGALVVGRFLAKRRTKSITT